MSVKLVLAAIALACIALANPLLENRATGGYVQQPSGQASFTNYNGCGSPGMHSAGDLVQITEAVA